MTASESPRRKFPLAAILWIAAAVALIATVAWAANAGLLTWETARNVRAAAQEFVDNYTVVAYAGYVALFVVLAVMLFPAQLWIIVFGAVLFGFWPALIVSWSASVLAATCVFLAARGFLADRYREKANRYLGRISTSFQRNQLTWMLTMRFVPVCPYFVSNAAPAFLGARLPPFILATMIGVIPSVSIYTFSGDRARAVLDANEAPDIASLARQLFPVLIALAILPLLALAVRRFGARRPSPPEPPLPPSAR